MADNGTNATDDERGPEDDRIELPGRETYDRHAHDLEELSGEEIVEDAIELFGAEVDEDDPKMRRPPG